MEQTDKEIILSKVKSLPDDTTYDEVIRELAFHGMIKRGLEDSKLGRTLSEEELDEEIKKWEK